MRFDEFSDAEKAAVERVIDTLKGTPPEDGVHVMASIIVGTIHASFCAEHAPEQLDSLINLMREGLQAQIKGQRISEELKRRSLQ